MQFSLSNLWPCVAAYLTSLGETWGHWIGMTDLGEESGFIWSDGSPVREGGYTTHYVVGWSDFLRKKKWTPAMLRQNFFRMTISKLHVFFSFQLGEGLRKLRLLLYSNIMKTN